MNRYDEKLKETYKQIYHNIKESEIRLEEYRKLLNEAIQKKDESEIKMYESFVKYFEEIKYYTSCKLDEIRQPFSTDINERSLMLWFMDAVNATIPNDSHIVFHGNANIKQVEDIISSGGLFTQADRGYEVSWASRCLCTCYKSDIRIASDIANGNNMCLPYGALFVLGPGSLDESMDFVNGKRRSASIDFHEEPDRLVAVITTSENLDRLKKKMRESGLDENKVMNHGSFIKMCEAKFASDNYSHSVR